MDEAQPVAARALPWRSFAWVTGGAVVVALLADGALAWLLDVPGAEVSVGEDALVAEAPAPVRPRSTRLDEREYVQGILERNLFDPDAIGKGAGPDGDGGGGPVDLNLKLRGTVVADPPIYSAAFLEEDGVAVVRAYGIGQVVAGAEILEIERFRVKVRFREEDSWIEVGGEGGGERESAGPAPSVADGVSSEGETKFTVSRALLDEKLADLAALQKEARALLHRGPDGEYDGYRLSAIRRGSLLDSIGVKNGDIIHNVNGLDLNSMDGAMRALEQLRSESRLKVEVTRRGSPVTLEYEVR